MRVLAVDDHQILLIGLRLILSREGWAVGQAMTYDDALRQLQMQRFDAVLVDLKLPRTWGDSNEASVGIELLHHIRQSAPQMPALMVTSIEWKEAPRYLFFAERVGAAGYFLKDSHLQIIQGLKALRAGSTQTLFTPEQRCCLMKFVRERPTLTPREREALCCLAQRLSHKEMAVKLGVAPTTIKTHLHSAYEKLDVSDAYEALNQGRHWGFLESGWLCDEFARLYER